MSGVPPSAVRIVLLNTIGGASTIDVAYRRAALSLGSKPRDVFWRIIFPGTLLSIFTGMAVGMGISWEMVVASEMIAGQTGLGYLLWASFEINAIARVILCMISIGIAGYVSSAIIRAIGDLAMPWRRLFSGQGATAVERAERSMVRRVRWWYSSSPGVHAPAISVDLRSLRAGTDLGVPPARLSSGRRPSVSARRRPRPDLALRLDGLLDGVHDRRGGRSVGDLCAPVLDVRAPVHQQLT